MTEMPPHVPILEAGEQQVAQVFLLLETQAHDGPAPWDRLWKSGWWQPDL